jgi:hypothetical protein
MQGKIVGNSFLVAFLAQAVLMHILNYYMTLIGVGFYFLLILFLMLHPRLEERIVKPINIKAKYFLWASSLLKS